MRRQLRGFARTDDLVLGNLDVSEIPRDVQVLAHGTSDHGDLAAALDRDVGRLLHAVDVRSERRDEDLPGAEREQRAESLSDQPLGAGRSRSLGVRGVSEQEVDAAISDLGELADIRSEPVDRRVVELPVPRVHDAPRIRLDDERDRVGDRVRNADQLDAKRAELQRSTFRIAFDELRCLSEPVLVELRLDEPEREPRRDHGLDLDLAKQVRQAADVILVPVREDHRSHAASRQVADVRKQEIDPQMLVAREREARIDHEHLSPGLVHGHVLADLAEAAERDDPEGVAHLD